MARFIGVWQKFRDIVRDVLGYGVDRTGIIVLGYGSHEIRVRTGGKPDHVYISICKSRHHPVCHGGVTMVGTTIHENGFTLYANVQSDTCEIEWIAEYS